MTKQKRPDAGSWSEIVASEPEQCTIVKSIFISDVKTFPCVQVNTVIEVTE